MAKKALHKVSHADVSVHEGDSVGAVGTGEAAPPPDTHHLEALTVAGVSPAQDEEWIQVVANVAADGPTGRVGVITAHKIAAALIAHEDKERDHG